MWDSSFTVLPGERLDQLNEQGLFVIQAERGYRFSMDAVLLSHFVRLKKRERAVDLGTGCGVIPLLLSSREETLVIDACELDGAAAARAARSVRGNGLEDRIHIFQADLRALPDLFPRGAYHLAVSNPPYGGRACTGPEKILPTTEAGCTFEDVVRAAKILLRFSGRFACCWPAVRLQEALTVLSEYRFAVKRLRPVCAKAGRNPYLCLIEAVSGGHAGMVMETPLVVMTQDGTYTDEFHRIYGDR